MHPHLATPTTTAAAAQITLLGGFRVTVDGTPTPSRGWSRRGAAALVKILALAPGHSLHREEVLDLLWPDDAPDQSAPRLHKAAHYARRAAGRADCVVLRGDVVRLFPECTVVVDAVRFEQLARAAVADGDVGLARQALGWYGGELLPGDRYDEWASERRQLLALRHLDVLRVAGEWRELAERAPTDEHAHVELIRRHLAAGDGVAAMAQYEHLEQVLATELGIAPGSEARRLRWEASALPACATVPAARPVRPSATAIEALRTELAELTERRTVLLAALAAAGASPEQVPELAAAA